MQQPQRFIHVDAKAVGRGHLAQLLHALPKQAGHLAEHPMTLANMANYTHLLYAVLLCITCNKDVEAVRVHLSALVADHPARYPDGHIPSKDQIMLDLLQDGHELIENLSGTDLYRYLATAAVFLSTPVGNDEIKYLQNTQGIVSIALSALRKAQDGEQMP